MMGRADHQAQPWHPCLLPDSYLKKLRQDFEAEAQVETETRYVPVPDDPPPPDDDA
jgi:hypothetical protein